MANKENLKEQELSVSEIKDKCTEYNIEIDAINEILGKLYLNELLKHGFSATDGECGVIRDPTVRVGFYTLNLRLFVESYFQYVDDKINKLTELRKVNGDFEVDEYIGRTIQRLTQLSEEYNIRKEFIQRSWNGWNKNDE